MTERQGKQTEFLLYVHSFYPAVFMSSSLTIPTFTDVINKGTPCVEKHAFSSVIAKQNRFEQIPQDLLSLLEKRLNFLALQITSWMACNSIFMNIQLSVAYLKVQVSLCILFLNAWHQTAGNFLNIMYKKWLYCDNLGQTL